MLNLSDIPRLNENQHLKFSLEDTSPLGIVAVNGNLSPGVLLSAYRQGIFPWYDDESPILWWSPDPRFILTPGELHIPRSLRKGLRKAGFSLTVDQAFPDVIRECARVPRREQEGTWIVPEMQQAYNRLHNLGFAHSVEVWRDEELVGGLYGVSLGRVFFGESMFSLLSNASKAAFVLFVLALEEKGFGLMDCQVYTEHLSQFGAYELPRAEFLPLLQEVLDAPTKRGSWSSWIDLEGITARFLNQSGQRKGEWNCKHTQDSRNDDDVLGVVGDRSVTGGQHVGEDSRRQR